MRSVQTVLVKGVLLLLLLAAIGLVGWYYPVPLLREALLRALHLLPGDAVVRQQLLIAAGGMLALVAVIGLIPLPPAGGGRCVTFVTGRGTVTIRLRPLYRALKKIIRKMPEVRSCRFDVRHGADGKTLEIRADARLYKIPRQRARDTAMRVNDIITGAVVNLLGIDELLSVDLNVRDFTVDTRAAVQHLRQDNPATKEPPMDLEGVAAVRIDEVEVPEVSLDSESLEAFEEPTMASLHSVDLPDLYAEDAPVARVEVVEESAPVATMEVVSPHEVLPMAEETVEAEETTEAEEAVDAEVEQVEDEPAARDEFRNLAAQWEPEAGDLDRDEQVLPPLGGLEEDEGGEAGGEDEEETRKDDPGDPWSL